MSIEFLKRLYWACTDENRHAADERNLNEMYQRIADTGTADQAFREACEKANLDPDAKESISSASVKAIDAYEQQGFINGFRLCTRLVQELSAKESPLGRAGAPIQE